jgi:hypothetical protein
MQTRPRSACVDFGTASCRFLATRRDTRHAHRARAAAAPQVGVSAISAPPRPGGKGKDEIQDLNTGSGGYTNTNQELRRIVPEAKGRPVVRIRRRTAAACRMPETPSCGALLLRCYSGVSSSLAPRDAPAARLLRAHAPHARSTRAAAALHRRLVI